MNNPVAFVLQSVFGKADARRFLAQPHTCSAFQVLEQIDERTEAEKSAWLAGISARRGF